MWLHLKKGKGLPSLVTLLFFSCTAHAGEWSSAIQSGFLQFDHIVIPIAPRDPFLVDNQKSDPATAPYSAVPLGLALGYETKIFPADLKYTTTVDYLKAVTVNTPTSTQNATPSYSRLDLRQSLSYSFIPNIETGGLVKINRDGFSDGSLTHTFVALSLGLKAEAKISQRIGFVSEAYHSVWGEFGFSDHRDWMASKVKDSSADTYGWSLGFQSILGEKTRALALFERENIDVQYRSYDAYEPFGFALAQDQEFVTRNLHLDTDLYSITLVRVF